MSCNLNKKNSLLGTAIGSFADVTTTPATKTYSGGTRVGNFDRLAFVVRSSGGVPLTGDSLPKITLEVSDLQDFSDPNAVIVQVCESLDFTQLESSAVPSFTQVAIEGRLGTIGAAIELSTPRLSNEQKYAVANGYVRVGIETVDAETFEVCYLLTNPMFDYRCDEHYDDWVGALPCADESASVTPIGLIELPEQFNNQLDIQFDTNGVAQSDAFDAINDFATTTTYYVNYDEGDNSNLGTSSGVGNSWKTFDFAHANAVSPATIILEDDTIGYLSSGISDKEFDGDFKIVGQGNWLGRGRTIIAGMRESYTQASFAWSSIGGSGAWECTNVQAKQFRSQFDPRTIDIDGFPLPVTFAGSRAACEATEGTFFWETGILTVHLAGGVEPDPWVNWLYAESANDFEVQNTVSNGKITFENIEIVHNTGTVKAGFRYRPDTTGVANNQRFGLKNILVYGCSGAGFQVYECEVFVLQDCYSKFTRSDGGNWHTFGAVDGEWMTGYVLDSNFKEVGFDGWMAQPALGTSENGCSAHDDIHLLRANCQHSNTNGAVVADVSGSTTVSLFVTAENPQGTASPNSLFWVDGVSGTVDDGMWLYKCGGVTDVGEETLTNTNSGNLYVEDWVGDLFLADTSGAIKNWDGSAYTDWS